MEPPELFLNAKTPNRPAQRRPATSSRRGSRPSRAMLRATGRQLASSSPAMSDLQRDIIGVWAASAPVAFRVVLSADGSGDFNGSSGRWTLENGTLTIGNENGSHAFEATLAGDELT